MLYTVDTRWWQLKYFLFPPRKLGKIPLFEEDFQFDSYFSDGLVQPPTRDGTDAAALRICDPGSNRF